MPKSVERVLTFKPPRPRRGAPPLSPTEWADAALVDIGKKGIEALAVEPLAARLRVTKGSFYWHFRDRRALLEAALGRWEQLGTERVIAELDQLPDPRERLRRLLTVAFNGPLDIELAIVSAGDDPLVGPIVKRVLLRRLDYLVSLFRAAGLPARRARTAGIHAFAAYLGAQHVLHTTPQYFRAQDRADFVATLSAALLSGRR
jgi:AcrR family transcriptional regulator